MQVRYVSFPSIRSYGVELEVLATPNSKERIREIILSEDKKHVSRITGWGSSSNNTYWHIKDDSSCGWEIASFKARGVDDLITISNVARALSIGGCMVSNQCGFHIHVEVNDFDSNQVGNLLARWVKIESILCSILPSHRIKNQYCNSVREFYHSILSRKYKSSKTFWSAASARLERKLALNVCNYAYDGSKRTVEFRMPEGTLDSSEIKNWVRLLVRFVSFSKKKRFPENLDNVGLEETLRILGLTGTDKFFILSKGLRDTKDWFLRRLLRYGNSKEIKNEAIVILNRMWSPLKVHDFL